MTIVPLIYTTFTGSGTDKTYAFLLMEAAKMEEYILKWLSGSDFLATG
jgi:hypothetical protein